MNEVILVNQEQMDNLNKWFDDLLSGKFVQGRTALKVDNNNICEYCCLGVACEINQIPNVFYRDVSDSDDYSTNLFSYNFSDTIEDGQEKMTSYPDINWFVKKYGFRYDVEFSQCPVTDQYDNISFVDLTVAQMNDRGYTFKQIVDKIRPCFKVIPT